MKKIIFAILFVFLLTSNTLFINRVHAADKIVIGNYENATMGSYVELGGKTWRLISDNYIMLDQPLTQFVFSSKEDCNSYVTSDIRYYLNNDFINKLGVDKMFLSDNDWGIGTEAFEDSVTVAGKVSLPSYNDMKVIHNLLPEYNNNVWTRTQVEGSNRYKVWCINTLTNSFTDQEVKTSALAYPVAYINPNVLVYGSGTKENPYVISKLLDKNDKTVVTDFTIRPYNINLNIGDNYNLTTLITFADKTIKRLISADGYQNDENLISNKSVKTYETLVTGDKISYSSSNPAVAEINDLGGITAKQIGKSLITVKYKGWTAKAIVVVN